MDKTLTCSDCGNAFTFTESEQSFFATKGFSEPKRCPECRAIRKAQNGGGGASAGGRSYGGSAEMFEATCATCGNVARVPFRPTSGKPVYCSDCFRSR